MEENGTDLDSVLNDQPASIEVQQEPTPQVPIDQGVTQAEPPTAKPQESDHVPRAALQDERRKRQEMEQELRTLREHVMRQQQPRQAQPEAPKTLKPEQFETYEQYMEALAESKAEAKASAVFEARLRQMSEAQQVAQVQQQTAADLGDMLTAGREKYADFDEVVANPSVPISDAMMTVMMAIDGGHEVSYHLGRNPAEAARIYRLPPSSQAREVAKLAKQLATPAPVATPPQLPKTLTTTRSTDGRFTKPGAWNGPTPLNDLLK